MLDYLRLLQLADSALPIGSLSHSFGLECLTEEKHLSVEGLSAYLGDLLQEGLLLDAVYCRAAHGRAFANAPVHDLNQRLNAIRLARESRLASLALGRRFLKLASALASSARLTSAALSDNHFAVAFGFTCGVLEFDGGETVAAFLHQTILNTISAAQRLLPLGQSQASSIAWNLKPAIDQAVKRSAILSVEDASCFSHLPELSSMRHPSLPTRLFIS